MKIRALLTAGIISTGTMLAPFGSPEALGVAGCFPKCQVEGVIAGTGIIPDPGALYIDGAFNGLVLDPFTQHASYEFLRFDLKAELYFDGIQHKGWADFRLYDPGSLDTLMVTRVHLRGRDSAFATEIPTNEDGVAMLVIARNPATGFWAGNITFVPAPEVGP